MTTKYRIREVQEVEFDTLAIPLEPGEPRPQDADDVAELIEELGGVAALVDDCARRSPTCSRTRSGTAPVRSYRAALQRLREEASK